MNEILIKWQEINKQNLPIHSGVYAWYYSHDLGDYDIENIIKEITEVESENEKNKVVREYLSKHLFSLYQEMPYDVSISGKLKAQYSGRIAHQQFVTNSLVEKIIDNPQLLKHVKESLSEIGFAFSSPLYIGMAKSLSNRIIQHKKLIVRYSENPSYTQAKFDSDEEEADHNFAARIINKKFDETSLYVIIKAISHEDSLHNVIENILNRISYPILGRN